MLIKHIEGATRVLGKSQGYLGLPVRDVIFDDGTRAMMTAWEPTPDELKALLAGAPIILSVIGTGHPPVILSVGTLPIVE